MNVPIGRPTPICNKLVLDYFELVNHDLRKISGQRKSLFKELAKRYQ